MDRSEDDCTAVEKGPQAFVVNVLMLDCSEGSINGWHVLSISWGCTPVACTTSASAALEKNSLHADEMKSFVDVSNTSWNENKALSSHCRSL